MDSSQHLPDAQRAAAAGAVEEISGSRCELLVFRGIWASRLCRGDEVQRAGDEFRGIEAVGLGLEDLEELARNLSRKCCSQSAEGMVVV